MLNNKIENGNKGMCQRKNKPTKNQKTVEWHGWVFSTARKPHTRAQLAINKMCTSSMKMDVTPNSKHINELK